MRTPLISHAEPVDGHSSGGFGSRATGRTHHRDTESHRGKPSVDGHRSGGFGSFVRRGGWTGSRTTSRTHHRGHRGTQRKAVCGRLHVRRLWLFCSTRRLDWIQDNQQNSPQRTQRHTEESGLWTVTRQAALALCSIGRPDWIQCDRQNSPQMRTPLISHAEPVDGHSSGGTGKTHHRGHGVTQRKAVCGRSQVRRL
jgi:hypothetical protein